MKNKINLISSLAIFMILFAYARANAQSDGYLPFAEVMPQPIGGMESIYKHISYPEMAKNAGVEGKVYVLVFINQQGHVDDVKVLKGIGGGCDEAAVNGIKEVKFSPGKQAGQPVKVKLSLPIDFKLR